jgi:hypothetical protein
MKYTPFLILPFALILNSQSAHAWGNEGHEVVALIAQQVLTKQSARDPQAAKALAAVQSILGSTSIDQAAIWPDEVKNLARSCSTPPYVKDPNWGKDPYKGKSSAVCDAYNYTSSWHFINSDSSSYAIDPNGKDYFKGDMVVMINGLSHVLKGEQSSVLSGVRSYDTWKAACVGKPDHQDGACKKEALEFLIHLVGDVHQPLHAGANCDLGANLQQIQFFGQDNDPTAFWCTSKKPKNSSDVKGAHAYAVCEHHELHQAWDTNILVHGPNSAFTSAQAYATSLVKIMTSAKQSYDSTKCVTTSPDQPVSVDGANGPVAWVNESLCYQPQVYTFPDETSNSAKSSKESNKEPKRSVAQAGIASIPNRCRADKTVKALDDAGQVVQIHGEDKVDYFTPFAVGPKYSEVNLPTINERLYWGGVRLASLLKDIYGTGDKAANF